MLKQEIILMAYNKDVVCVIDKDQQPLCKTFRRSLRRTDTVDTNNYTPSHDPYIPQTNNLLYECSSTECKLVMLKSLKQLSFPNMQLKSCIYQKNIDDYECKTIKYHNFKNIDKLLFLRHNIRNKTFYLVDCLVYSDGGRVCHKKDNAESHTKLVDTGTIARPKEPNILAQNEFICEESDDKKIYCDLNPYIPYSSGLKVREILKLKEDVLLKTGTYVAILKRNCFETWCGYSGQIVPSRRNYYNYEPPGGKVYRCYYAKKQQICKELYTDNRSYYNYKFK